MACDIDDREGEIPFADGTPTGADVPQLGDRSPPENKSSSGARRLSSRFIPKITTATDGYWRMPFKETAGTGIAYSNVVDASTAVGESLARRTVDPACLHSHHRPAGFGSHITTMTYSIVARDHLSGELGVAVQSRYFAVGAAVPWASPGVGAVATQAMVNVSHGPRALELLESGLDARAALDRLIGADDGAAVRQLAIVDAAGNAAVHTGGSCVREAGHVARDGVCCQGNILASDRVWVAMLDGFESATGSLQHRLLAALEAGEAEGGDLRGRQSAAILVAPPAGERWDTTVWIRVDDHPEPLLELRRLITLADAYALAAEANGLMDAGDDAHARLLCERACELAPESDDLLFRAGVSLAEMGDLDAGISYVRRAIEMRPSWTRMLDRLPSELAAIAATLIAQLNE